MITQIFRYETYLSVYFINDEGNKNDGYKCVDGVDPVYRRVCMFLDLLDPTNPGENEYFITKEEWDAVAEGV